MSSPAVRSPRSSAIDPRLAPAINRLLIAGMKLGRAGKRDAVTKALQLVPGWTRGDCWQRMRQLRRAVTVVPSDNSGDQSRLIQQTESTRRLAPARWTVEDDEKLLNWAGYEPVGKIAQRLSRSVRAVRFRLCALGMSGRVTDGWSQRALTKLLRVSPDRLRHLIGAGMLHVRDGRITAASLAQFCRGNEALLSSAIREKLATVAAKKREAYPWELAAELLGVDLNQVQSWISAGQLKVMDTFVTDRSFEEFCRKHGSAINIALIDSATVKWLVDEYGMFLSSPGEAAVSRAQKHALKVRTCKCGRKIAGNVYFRHSKACKTTANFTMRQAI